MVIDTEIKFDADHTVTTEERFALRRWFQEALGFLNTGAWDEYGKELSDYLNVNGFTEGVLIKPLYLEFLRSLGFGTAAVVARYPVIKVSVKLSYFSLVGTFEAFFDGVLSYEGNIEVLVMKVDDSYQVMEIKFYPHMIVSS